MSDPKRLVIFSNWKIFMQTRKQVSDFVETLKKALRPEYMQFLDIFIIPDFLSFEFVKRNTASLNIKVGVQDMFWEDYGPFAGEVAPSMLKDLKCDCAYFGHSERRSYFGETDENINKKIKAALRNDITPFLFVGETREELDRGMTDIVLDQQIKTCLKDIDSISFQKILLVYEPRWAIGQKDPATVKVIESSHKKVRDLLAGRYGQEIASHTRILYGGSVNTENIVQIMSIGEVDGAAATRASIDPEGFLALIEVAAAEARSRNT